MSELTLGGLWFTIIISIIVGFFTYSGLAIISTIFLVFLMLKVPKLLFVSNSDRLFFIIPMITSCILFSFINWLSFLSMAGFFLFLCYHAEMLSAQEYNAI